MTLSDPPINENVASQFDTEFKREAAFDRLAAVLLEEEGDAFAFNNRPAPYDLGAEDERR